jgi:hypothetical protein
MEAISSKLPTYSPDEVLERYDVKKLSSFTAMEDPSTGLPQWVPTQSLQHPAGWLFSSRHGKILNECSNKRFIECVNRNLLHNDNLADSIIINDCHLRPPPMFFGNDILQIKFGSALFCLDASDSLLCWAAQVITGC